MSTKVIMKGVTLSYPHLHTPQPGKNGGKPKYSGAFIAPPGYNLGAAGRSDRGRRSEVSRQGS
jgi:hypothetical protein